MYRAVTSVAEEVAVQIHRGFDARVPELLLQPFHGAIDRWRQHNRSVCVAQVVPADPLDAEAIKQRAEVTPNENIDRSGLPIRLKTLVKRLLANEGMYTLSRKDSESLFAVDFLLDSADWPGGPQNQTNWQSALESGQKAFQRQELQRHIHEYDIIQNNGDAYRHDQNNLTL